MGKRSGFIALLLLALAVDANSQSNAVPAAEWKRLASPEQAGWSAKSLAKIRDYLEEIGSTSAMIVQHGVVVAAWGDITHRSNLHSCRKSLLNALIGIAVADGKINLDDTLAKLGIDDKKPSLTEAEKQATIRELLEARSGVYHPTVYETKGMEEKNLHAALMHQAPSGITTTGTSTPWATFTSKALARRYSTPSTARSLSPLACRTFDHVTGIISLDPIRASLPIRSR
jgi:CubicO group peptidase (beta-lactamase class C family)